MKSTIDFTSADVQAAQVAQDGRFDLRHYLNQASIRLRNQMKEIKTNNADGLARVQQLRMLEELIKEQLPNENTGTATRQTR